MFIGEYKTSITPGKRVAIPKALRQYLEGDSVILTRGYEGCVVLVEESKCNNLLDGVADVPFISSDKRETSRFLLSGAHKVKPDSQGRFVLPDSLIEYGGMNGAEVVFLGVGRWIEIWDLARWREYREQLDQQSTEIAERLARLNRS